MVCSSSGATLGFQEAMVTPFNTLPRMTNLTSKSYENISKFVLCQWFSYYLLVSMLFLFLYFGLKNYPQTYQDNHLVSILMEDGLSLFCAYLVWILHLECNVIIYTLHMLTPCIICKFMKIYWKFFLPTKK